MWVWKRCPHRFTVARLLPSCSLVTGQLWTNSILGWEDVCCSRNWCEDETATIHAGLPGSRPAIIYSVNSTCCYFGCLVGWDVHSIGFGLVSELLLRGPLETLWSFTSFYKWSWLTCGKYTWGSNTLYMNKCVELAVADTEGVYRVHQSPPPTTIQNIYFFGLICYFSLVLLKIKNRVKQPLWKKTFIENNPSTQKWVLEACLSCVWVCGIFVTSRKFLVIAKVVLSYSGSI